MNSDSRVVQLCIAGAQAEFDRRRDDAARLYAAAWDAATDDFEACVAAHYVARFQPDAQATLHWNKVALARAEAVNDERVQPFFPSLYLNLGQSYEDLGQPTEAQQYYSLAAALGFPHQPDRE
ncbi:MAG: hypothetical protein M9936_13265 [Caldilinea sp.]|nr:hypothetical protein [Caldilinea sp.]MCW5841320.1 hypothetical protein [Caldilinea sp.]